MRKNRLDCLCCLNDKLMAGDMLDCPVPSVEQVEGCSQLPPMLADTECDGRDRKAFLTLRQELGLVGFRPDFSLLFLLGSSYRLCLRMTVESAASHEKNPADSVCTSSAATANALAPCCRRFGCSFCLSEQLGSALEASGSVHDSGLGRLHLHEAPTETILQVGSFFHAAFMPA